MKTLIIYSYRDYPDSASNFKYFINKTLPILSHNTLLVAYNDNKFIDTSSSNSSVKYFKTHATIDADDFSYLLTRVNINDYTHFIFLNSSCVGPILPSYSDKDWISIINSNITTKIKLVSPVVEVPPDSLGAKCLPKHMYIRKYDGSIPFAHTYFFATDLIGLKILFQYDALSENQIDKDQAIHHFERLVSSCILNEEYEIRSLLKIHEYISWLDKNNWHYNLWSSSGITCPEVPGNYMGTDISPYEVMFFKNIRHPHKHRSPENSGISINNETYLQNIIKATMST